ncbi:hypothetical protein [Caldisericum sp.]|uniref:hypothetical protein n=1 Tax=Caldisericum sp. TaxID=2499687 RepID=UPI003CBFB023
MEILNNYSFTEDEEEESELKYFRIIEEIRDKNPELFERIKRLPKKARSAKVFSDLSTEEPKINFAITLRT